MTKSVRERRTDCAARYHDTYSAYQRASCRCPKAREEHRLYMKRAREGRNEPRRVDATGTQRRIYALMALGHTAAVIGAQVGMSAFAIQQTAMNRRYVSHEVRARIIAAYTSLSLVVGASETTRRRAARNGYAPPLAWDDETIDDPATEPNFGRKVDEGTDEVAIDRVARGESPFGSLAKVEQIELFRRYGNSASRSSLSKLWGVSGDRLKTVAARAQVAA